MLARREMSTWDPSDKARVALILGISEHLEDKKNRVPVLQAITGLPLASQNNLTGYYVGTLIGEIRETADVGDIIKTIEAAIREKSAESGPGFQAWNLFPE
jgi:hypothetical protein